MGLISRWWVVSVFYCLPAAAEWKASINADVTATGLYWNEATLGADNKQIRGIYTLKLPATIKNGRALRFRFLPLVELDPQNPSSVDPQHPQRNERTYWDLQEAYVQYQSLPWTFQVGNNVQTWGDTDVFNPLDVVNPRRFYDPFRSEKIGSPTVLVKREWETVMAEALWIPYQPETLLPGENSRWLPRDVYKSRSFEDSPFINGTTLSGVINLPSDLRYHYRQKAVLNAATRDNFGTRLKFRFPGFDWTVAAFQGAAPTPSVNLKDIALNTVTASAGTTRLDISVKPDVGLQALYYKSRMVGTSFVWVLGDYLVKGASAYNKVVSSLKGATEAGGSVENRLPKDDWDNALGFERSFGVGSGTLTALLQGTYVERKDGLDTSTVSLSRMFDRAVMTGLRWAPTERWVAMASVLYDIRYKGNLIGGEASYKISDGLTGKLSAAFVDGKTETPLGTYKRNDRIALSLNLQK